MQKFIALLVSVSAANSSNALILPPSIPAAWPSIDQSVMISGAFLNDPLVTNALTYVESVVSPRLLAIMPSSYILESTVTYGADPIANCYWPRGACARASDTADFKADVSSCPSENDWGLTYDDGPTVDPVASGNDTPGIRKALAAANLKATFFIVGSNAIRFPQEILNTYNVGMYLNLPFYKCLLSADSEPTVYTAVFTSLKSNTARYVWFIFLFDFFGQHNRFSKISKLSYIFINIYLFDELDANDYIAELLGVKMMTKRINRQLTLKTPKNLHLSLPPQYRGIYCAKISTSVFFPLSFEFIYY